MKRRVFAHIIAFAFINNYITCRRKFISLLLLRCCFFDRSVDDGDIDDQCSYAESYVSAPDVDTEKERRERGGLEVHQVP